MEYVNKKGEGKYNPGQVILILIALFLVLYVMFISPEERNNLLYDSDEKIAETVKNNNYKGFLHIKFAAINYMKNYITKTFKYQ